MYGKRVPATFAPVSLTFETREEFQTAMECFLFIRDHMRPSGYSSICSEMIDSLDAA